MSLEEMPVEKPKLSREVIDKAVKEVAKNFYTPVMVILLDEPGNDVDLQIIFDKKKVKDVPQLKSRFNEVLSDELQHQGYNDVKLDIFAYSLDDYRRGNMESYAMSFEGDADPEYHLLKPVRVDQAGLLKINKIGNGPFFKFKGRQLTDIVLTDTSLTAFFLYPRMTLLFKSPFMKDIPEPDELYDKVQITQRGIVNWKLQYLARFAKEFIDTLGFLEKQIDLENMNRLAKYDIRYRFSEMLSKLDVSQLSELKDRYKFLLTDRKDHKVNVDNVLVQLIVEFDKNTDFKNNAKISNFLRVVTKMPIFDQLNTLSEMDNIKLHKYRKDTQNYLIGRIIDIDREIYIPLVERAAAMEVTMSKVINNWKIWVIVMLKRNYYNFTDKTRTGSI